MFAMMTIATLGMGFAFGGMIMMLFWLVFLVIWLYMMWKAYSGEKIVLPVIGEIAEKNA
jgi:uncharacterized membrane protein